MTSDQIDGTLSDERIAQIFYPMSTASDNQKLIAIGIARAIERIVESRYKQPGSKPICQVRRDADQHWVDAFDWEFESFLAKGWEGQVLHVTKPQLHECPDCGNRSHISASAIEHEDWCKDRS